MTEVWKEIPDFPGYEVSSEGRVRCWRPIGSRNPPMEPRILKPKGLGTKRYLAVVLGYKGPTREIHRMVAELFVSGQGQGLHAAHENGNKHDNRATNLRWKTPKANGEDKIRHGTNGKSLTLEVVEAIRAEYEPGRITQKELALKYGTTQATISKIIRRQRWGAAA